MRREYIDSAWKLPQREHCSEFSKPHILFIFCRCVDYISQELLCKIETHEKLAVCITWLSESDL